MHAFGVAIALLATVVVLVWAVTQRRKSDGGGVELADVALALVPVVVWLILVGGLDEIKFGRDELSIKLRDTLDASVNTTLSPLRVEAAPVEVQPLSTAGKPGDTAHLSSFIAEQKQGIILQLGTNYYTDVFRVDLHTLIPFPHFRFVVLQQNGGGFFGMIDARELTAQLDKVTGWDAFIAAVAKPTPDTTYFTALPGFVGMAMAVSAKTSIIDVLQAMKARHIDWLPVTGADTQLLGLAERSAVLAQLFVGLNSMTSK